MNEHNDLDEALLLTYLRHNRMDDTVEAKRESEDVAERDAAFYEEIQHFDKRASSAIKDLEMWIDLQDSLTENRNSQNHISNDNPTEDESTTVEDNESLTEELQIADRIFRNTSSSMSAEPTMVSEASTTPVSTESTPLTLEERQLSSLRASQMCRLALDTALLTDSDVLRLVHPEGDEESLCAVQFIGPTETATASVRSNKPLPRPQAVTSQQVSNHLKKAKNSKLRRFLRRFWKGRKHQVSESTLEGAVSNTSWVPFVLPFLCTEEESVCLVPGLISYFEVHILHGPSGSSLDANTGYEEKEEKKMALGLISIGMSIDSFRADKWVPGWAPFSFGYFRDGSVFFNQNQERQYCLAPFGPGDAIGCGIDYRRGQVFYTRNGKFLGYCCTLPREQLERIDWYPTVGLSASVCVQCNFGSDRPFAYDLRSMIEIGKQM